MKLDKQEWEHVAYLDGNEIYRATSKPPDIANIIRSLDADYLGNFLMEHKPEVVYKFRSKIKHDKT